jgi:hypothetical protein
MEKEYLEQINKIIENYRKEGVKHKDCNCVFDTENRLVRMCLDCNVVFSESRKIEQKLTINKCDKLFSIPSYVNVKDDGVWEIELKEEIKPNDVISFEKDGVYIKRKV